MLVDGGGAAQPDSQPVGPDLARRPGVGAIWQRFKDNIERPIAAILVLNTAAHTIGASVAGAEFDALFGDQWILVFSLVFTYLMLQFTENDLFHADESQRLASGGSDSAPA